MLPRAESGYANEWCSSTFHWLLVSQKRIFSRVKAGDVDFPKAISAHVNEVAGETGPKVFHVGALGELTPTMEPLEPFKQKIKFSLPAWIGTVPSKGTMSWLSARRATSAARCPTHRRHRLALDRKRSITIVADQIGDRTAVSYAGVQLQQPIVITRESI